jgi:hypothetical protein
MEDYDSIDFTDAFDWGSRFPQDAIGYSELLGLPFSPEGNREAWRRVSLLQVVKSTPQVSRLFVSHRQKKDDRDWALRAAFLATQKGFYFWLDVLDPILPLVNHLNLNPQQKAIVTAVVIEVGLLNCSHVLCMVTPNSAGSLWVPYEYGRVKTDGLFSTQAGSWNHPLTPASSRGEYLELGVDTHNELEIETWLDSEFRSCYRTSPKARPWPHAQTSPLP